MTNQELKDRFMYYMREAVESKDPSKMKVLADSFTRLFNKVVDAHPDLASATLDILSAIEYHNYITSEEAVKIATSFINDDKSITGASEPSHGPHWKMDEMKAFLSARNIPTEDKPFYNWPALWLTVNMIYSDFAENIAEMTGSKENEKLAVSAYKMALKKLKDLDRPHFIREYFELDN